MINYIQILNRSIKINDDLIINKTFENYIDGLLINDLSTYQGRLNAIRKKYGFKKLIPIYINDLLCLFPLENKRSINNIYINVNAVKFVDDNGCLYFYDNSLIKSNKKGKTINKYIKRAKTIKKSKVII